MDQAVLEAVLREAQNVCNAMSVEEFKGLSPKTQYALLELAVRCGCTDARWWDINCPAWSEGKR